MATTVLNRPTSLDERTTTTSIQLDQLDSAKGHLQEKVESQVALLPIDDIPDGGFKAWGAVLGGYVYQQAEIIHTNYSYH